MLGRAAFVAMIYLYASCDLKHLRLRESGHQHQREK